MNDWNFLFILLLIVIDSLAIWNLTKSRQFSRVWKVLWTVIILLLPIVGISLYYFQVSLFHYNNQKKH